MNLASLKIDDPIIKRNDFIINMTLNEFISNDDEKTVSNIQLKNISNVKEIEETIKIYLLNHGENRTFDSMFRIDHKLIHLLLDKSFKGNPLFMHDLIGELFNKKLIQNCVEEIVTTSDLDDMELEKNYNDFEIPIRIEKICGEMIDLINEHDIILLKYASVIGNLFDINTLYNILPFKDVYLNDLYNTLKSFEKRGIVEFLYDLDSEHKIVVLKFACPFLKETLYQRMLIEQKSEIHLQVARHFQKNKLYYFTSKKIEENYLKKQLECGQKSIIKGMDENKEDKEEEIMLTRSSLQILLVHEITEKLKEVKEYGYGDIEILLKDNPNIDKDKLDALALAIKFGHLEKKSDGKITWEKRFFVLTPTKVQYYYNSKDYRLGNPPLGIFYLRDISDIKKLTDYTYRNKQYTFQVSVIKWKKKGKTKPKRAYVFSVEKMEKLDRWIISLNFLRFNAYYEAYTNSFGKMELPLYRVNDKKKKKLIFDIDSPTPIMYSSSAMHYNIIVKFTLSNNNQIDIDVIVFETFLILKKLIRRGFLNILGVIQQGIISQDKYSCYINNTQLNNIDSIDIKIPEHLVYSNAMLNDNSFLQSENDDNNKSIISYRTSKLSKQSFLIYYDDESGFINQDSNEYYYKICREPKKDWDNDSEKKMEKSMKEYNKKNNQDTKGNTIYEEENEIGKMPINDLRDSVMNSIDINNKTKNDLLFNDSIDEIEKKDSAMSSFLSKDI